MDDKAKEFFAAFKAGKMSRRELMSGAAKLGVSAATEIGRASCRERV